MIVNITGMPIIRYLAGQIRVQLLEHRGKMDLIEYLEVPKTRAKRFDAKGRQYNMLPKVGDRGLVPTKLLRKTKTMR